MELALYHPDAGFYTGSRMRGAGADFITAPEISPLFGCFVGAHALRLWQQASEPETLRIVEIGGASGTLARQIACIFGFTTGGKDALPPIRAALLPPIRAALGVEVPATPPELSYVLVDPGAGRRAGVLETLESIGGIDPLASHMTIVTASDLKAIGPGPLGGGGEGCTLVVANEVFDNVPSHLLVRDSGAVGELCVTLDCGRLALRVEQPAFAGDGAEPMWSPISALPREFYDRIAQASLCRFSPKAEIGVASPQQVRLAQEIGGVIARGGALVVDLAENPGRVPVVTYSGHRRGFDPFEGPGCTDLMVPVRWEPISAEFARSGLHPAPPRTQAEWLADNGLEALWDGLAESAEPQGKGLASLEPRSLMVSAKALSDPTALGAFLVLEWARL